MDAETLHQAALDALSVDDFDSARVYLRQAVQLAPQARLCNRVPEREVVLACVTAARAGAISLLLAWLAVAPRATTPLAEV